MDLILTKYEQLTRFFFAKIREERHYFNAISHINNDKSCLSLTVLASFGPINAGRVGDNYSGPPTPRVRSFVIKITQNRPCNALLLDDGFLYVGRTEARINTADVDEA